MKNDKSGFIPAAHYHWMTPYYHAFMKLFFGKSYRKIGTFIEFKPGQKLLDVGCGPGQMLGILLPLYPASSFAGVDIDPRILEIARKNLPGTVALTESSAASLPFPDQSFDVVLSTLMIHHLTSEDKEKMIREAYRVLKLGGAFYLMDFACPTTVLGKILTAIFRRVESLDDAIAGRYREWMKQASFKEVAPLYRLNGMMELLKGIK